MIIWLISANEIDNDYNHIPWFKTSESQATYFSQRKTYVLDDYMYQRKNNLVFNIDLSLEEIDNVNYLITINENNKKYFYFIVDKEYVNDNVTKVYLQLDVIQTYMFNINFNECFIEREHCKRWTTRNDGLYEVKEYLEDENLETGEYILKSEKTIYNYRTKGTYIYTSSERLGVSNDGRPNFNNNDGGSDEGDNTSSSENFKNGYLDENGLVFLKSKEGFASTPYQDIYGYWTTGYGITQAFQETYYNQLLPSCTEQKASEIMGQVVYNFSSQVKSLLDKIGYTNLNQNKLNALTSYAYQKGIGGFQSSRIYTYLSENRSDEEIAKVWVDDEFNTRRSEESIIFSTGVYPSMKISDVDNGGYITDNDGKGYIPYNYK